MIDLSNKVFPDIEKVGEMKQNGGQIISSAFDTFVKEGSLYVRSLNFNRQIRDVDYYSSKITCLFYWNNYVFGATSGEKSVLFSQHLYSAYDAVAPVYSFEKINDSKGLCVIGSNLYLGGNDSEKAYIVKTNLPIYFGDIIQEWDYPHISEEEIYSFDEKILSFKQSKINEKIIYIIGESGAFYKFNIENNSCEKIGIITKNFFSKVICEDNDGNIYLFKELGGIIKYDGERLRDTNIKIPCFPGKGPYAKISAALYIEEDNSLIVGDTEGLISKVNLCEDKSVPQIIPMGKPTSVGGVDFMVQIWDGRIYGIAGSLEGMAHLFVYNPKYNLLKDLGVCCATVEKGWYGYVMGDMLAIPDGHIVLGENDNLGCLFHYYPPII